MVEGGHRSPVEVGSGMQLFGPVAGAGDGAAGGQGDPLAAGRDVLVEEAVGVHLLAGAQHQQAVLGDGADGVVQAMLGDEGAIGAAVDRQGGALEQGEMAGVVVAVVGEALAGAEADEGGIRVPAGTDEGEVEPARTEQSGLRQIDAQALQVAVLHARHGCDPGVVEHLESPAIAAIVAFPPVQFRKIAGIAGQQPVVGELRDQVDEASRLVLEVHPRALVAQGLHAVVRPGAVQVPVGGAPQRLRHFLALARALQAVEIGRTGHGQLVGAVVDPVVVALRPGAGQLHGAHGVEEVPLGAASQGLVLGRAAVHRHRGDPGLGGQGGPAMPERGAVAVEQQQVFLQRLAQLLLHPRPLRGLPALEVVQQVVGDGDPPAVAVFAGSGRRLHAAVEDGRECASPRIGVALHQPAGGACHDVAAVAGVGQFLAGIEGTALPEPFQPFVGRLAGDLGEQDPRMGAAHAAVQLVVGIAGRGEEEVVDRALLDARTLEDGHRRLAGRHLVVAQQIDHRHQGGDVREQAGEHQVAPQRLGQSSRPVFHPPLAMYRFPVPPSRVRGDSW